MRRHKVFSSFLESQNYSFELLLSVVLVAIGVNFFSDGLLELLNFPGKDIVFVILGAIIALGFVFILIWLKLKGLKNTTNIEGFIIYNKKEKALVLVPEYRISCDMINYLQFAFSENKALEKLWKQDNIVEFQTLDEEQGERVIVKSTHSADVFLELLEYCVMEELSTHLTDYFNKQFGKPKIQEFGRADIPEILLQNRFLRLFSEDMDNRAAFACSDTHGDHKMGNIIMAYSSGAMYKKFDLILPQKSKINRKNKNTIAIETPLFKMLITCRFEGDGTVLPSSFHEYYLGLNDAILNYGNYKFHVEVDVSFKPKALFSKEKESYCAWIDSFLDTLANNMGEEEFFNRINWDSVHTMIICKLNLEKGSCTKK